jgi:hypothetical protein
MQEGTSVRILLASLLSPLLALSFAHAADRIVLGRSIKVTNPTGVEEKRTVTVRGQEDGTDVSAITSPLPAGATLTVVANGVVSTAQTYVLDSAGWRVSSAGYRYRGPTGIDGDPVKRVLIKRSPAGTALIQAVIKGNRGSQPLTIVPPNSGSDGGLVLDVVGGDRYCVKLGGGAGGAVRQDTARVWRIAGATAEDGCPALPSTTTTTVPSVCGNGVVEPAEACDGAALGQCGTFGLSCGAAGTSVGCQCCLRGGFVPNPPGGVVPYCCDGSFPIPLDRNFFVCSTCGGSFPLCGGDGCPEGEVCLPQIQQTPIATARTCSCFRPGVACCQPGGGTCPSGSVCAFAFPDLCGCAPQ